MTDALPAPLVAAEVDLRSYLFMPFYGDFLRASGFNCRATDSEYRAAVNLWWSSWKQVPASSLPDSDAELCRLADLGRDMKAWMKVRTVALSGFVKCADGRLYHEFLAVEAKKAWGEKQLAAAKGRKGADKRWGKSGTANTSTNAPAIAEASASQWPADSNRQDSREITPLPPLPEWLPRDPWNAFVEMRRSIRAPMTEHAKSLAISKLEKMRAEGHDPKDLLDAAVMNSWRSFYPPKGGPANTADGKKRLSI